jgi:hypothetical protein
MLAIDDERWSIFALENENSLADSIALKKSEIFWGVNQCPFLGEERKTSAHPECFSV